jgi:hypothetical protein
VELSLSSFIEKENTTDHPRTIAVLILRIALPTRTPSRGHRSCGSHHVLAPPYLFLLSLPSQTNPLYRVSRRHRLRLGELADMPLLFIHAATHAAVPGLFPPPSSIVLPIFPSHSERRPLRGLAVVLRAAADDRRRCGESAVGCSKGGAAVLRVVGSSATNSGGLFYKRRRALLPMAAALLQTAAGSATYGGGLCYKRRTNGGGGGCATNGGPAAAGSATYDGGLCYKLRTCQDWSTTNGGGRYDIRRRALLHTAADSATNGGRMCYIWCRALLPPAVKLQA